MTIGIANAITIDLRNTAVSLSTYLVSAFIGGQTANKVGARTRWWLLTSTLTQILMLVIPTVLVSNLNPPTFLDRQLPLLITAFYLYSSSLMIFHLRLNQINGYS